MTDDLHADDDIQSPIDDRLRASLTSVADTQRAVDDWPGVLALHDQVPADLDDARRRTRPRRTLALVAAAIIVVIGIGAAVTVATRDTSDGSVKAVSLADAAKASQSSTARVEFTQELEDGTASELQGEVDFASRSAHLRGNLGNTLGGGPNETDDLEGLSDEIGDSIAKMFQVLAAADEMIVVDDHGYIHADGTWWDFGPSDPEGQDGVDLLSPSSLLAQIGKLGKVRTVGTEEVRGHEATRYTATDAKEGIRYDVWVDGDDQVVRVTTEHDDPFPGEPARTTMELFDFGTPVKIEAPEGAKAFDTGMTVDADLHEVASGNQSGVGWKLATGPMADGRSCVQVTTEPALDGEQVLIAADSGGSTSTDVAPGTETGPSCGPLEVNGEGSSTGATVLAVGGRQGEVHYIAGLLADGAKVTVTFHDGRTEQLEGHDGAFVLWFTGDDWPKLIEGGNATCETQGDRTMSGNDLLC